MKAVNIIKIKKVNYSLKKPLLINMFLSIALFLDIILLILASISAFAKAVSDMKNDSYEYTSDPIYPADIMTTVYSILMYVLILFLIVVGIYIIICTFKLPQKTLSKNLFLILNIVINILYIIGFCIIFFNNDGWNYAMTTVLVIYPLITAISFFIMRKYISNLEKKQ